MNRKFIDRIFRFIFSGFRDGTPIDNNGKTSAIIIDNRPHHGDNDIIIIILGLDSAEQMCPCQLNGILTSHRKVNKRIIVE